MTNEEAYFLQEANTEIARHHRDFERISEVVHKALESEHPAAMLYALKKIRNIVG